VYVEDLSAGYWMATLAVEQWDQDYGAMDYLDHGTLSDFVYGRDDHPLVVREERHQATYIPVYPESSIPRDTLFVPGDTDDPAWDRECVLIAKATHAVKLLQFLSEDPL